MIPKRLESPVKPVKPVNVVSPVRAVKVVKPVMLVPLVKKMIGKTDVEEEFELVVVTELEAVALTLTTTLVELPLLPLLLEVVRPSKLSFHFFHSVLDAG